MRAARPGRAFLGRAALALVVLPFGLGFWSGPAVAQEGAGAAEASAAPQAYSRIAVISREELFLRTAFGAAMLARSEAERDGLQTENQRLDAALESEERDLTTRRAGLPATEFRKLAVAFDERVRGIRAAQESKARDVTRRAEEDRATFSRAAAPVIAALMADLGASVVLDKSMVVLSLDEVDITDQAIARIDAVLGSGPVVPDAPPPANP